MTARGARLQVVRNVPALPRRSRDAHKGTFGTVLVVAGSHDMLGAAILCARGALRAGAGLLRAALPRQLQVAFTLAVPPAVTIDRGRRRELLAAIDGASAIAIGPGLGRSAGTLRLVRDVLGHARVPVVLDADALNVFAPLRRKLPGSSPKILLPHPGEAARLLATTTARIGADRRASVVDLATASGGVAVLKGRGTLVCDGRRRFSNRTGNPGMATGGSGDVLAGIVAALLAQGMAPFDAAVLGVHVHGAAGDRVAARLSEAGLCADDLPLAVAEELR